MVGCKHVFMGKSDGVHCQKCGLHLTAQQYADLCNAKAMHAKAVGTAEKPMDKQNRKKKGANTDE